MPARRAKTVEEYVRMIDQAIDEVDELRMTAEYDPEGMPGVIKFIDDLDREIKSLKQQMKDGNYRFENKDLRFMIIVEEQDDRLFPFKTIFRMINETHKKGLDVDGEG